ncbi:hypothetical protein KAX02_08640 [candidate division WOR-3 bacterium]|nr:hypothetical protein [candidate division WOR-3 bacterium]
MITDPDILNAEITILKLREELLVLELEEVRASIGMYQNAMDITEEV